MLRASLILLVACKGEYLHWKPRVATTLTAGPFALAIPAGWRDLAENEDPTLAHMAARADETAHIIVREDAANTDTNVAVMWTTVPKAITCAQFFAALAQMGPSTNVDPSTTASFKLATDEVCKFHTKDHDSVGTTYLRMHDKGYATLSCLHDEHGDADADAICESLHLALVNQ